MTNLEFYTRPAYMTDAGEHAKLFDEIPNDIAALAGTCQGLILHQHIAPNYGAHPSAERMEEVHIRTVKQMLDTLLAKDKRPLSVPRPLETRLIGNCRHYSVLMVAMLRHKGFPARARCGFGTYFADNFCVDHWVAEYWDKAQSRWVRVDAQIDDVQRKLFHPKFNLLDVPHDRFQDAGYAWIGCRAGKFDADKYGIMDMHGLWFIVGDLIRDFAALNNMEMLPWDVWGAMAGPDKPLTDELKTFLDNVADLTQRPDERFDAVRKLYEDERLKVPKTIFNVIRNRVESV